MDEQPSVGNAILDADHKELFDLSRKIKTVIETSDHADLVQTLKQLRYCMDRHFQNEELFAHALNISFDEHRLDHENILAGVDIARREIRKTGEMDAFARSYVQYLHNWLTMHFNEKDLLMATMLQNHPYGFKVAGVLADSTAPFNADKY